MGQQTITFFGNFGTHNLGNECTLRAMVQNARRYMPEAKLRCVCPSPQDASERHAIRAFLMSYRYARPFPAVAPRAHHDPFFRLVRRVLIRGPRELPEWLKAFRILRDTNMLIMSGTGMLSDLGVGPFDLHYEILKWSLIAKLRRAKLLFVSVGAGPIDHPLSRWIVKSALSLADYRSYRDTFSHEYLQSIGFDTSMDPVYPDLVFSFPPSEIPLPQHRNGSACVIGLGLMDYYGKATSPQDRERTYQEYAHKMTDLAACLLANGYRLRLLIGDLAYDRRIKRDVVERLEASGLVSGPRQVIDEPIASVAQLWSQIAQVDMVVATRFHNVLLAMMLNKPVVAVSFHEKVRALMAGVGLEEYCQDVRHLDVRRLLGQVGELEQNAEMLRSLIKEKTDQYRRALDEQYRHIFCHAQAGLGCSHS